MEFDLDKTIIDLSKTDSKLCWTVRDSVEGVQIFGGIGSGKTSGSGRFIALKFLRNNYGGLVLTAKHDEKELWTEYCRLTNRLHDLVIVEPGGKECFNFLEYESSHIGVNSSLTVNLVLVLKTVIRAGQDAGDSSKDDKFWQTALDMLLANTIDLCLIAYGRVTVKMLYDIAQSAPKRGITGAGIQTLPKEDPDNPTAFKKAFDVAMDNIQNQVKSWRSRIPSHEYQAIKTDDEFTRLASEALPDVRRMDFIVNFFNDTYKNLADKTRSIIDFNLLGFLYNLLREPTYSLFCRYASTFVPEDSLTGKIILLNLPVKDYHKMGKDCQVMFKYIWQRAMERRRVGENGRPVFLWADEAQNFLHEHDADYQATARSSRIATVYISQNLPNYFANMGGTNANYRVKSFLGTLGTKIFHANVDIETNQYASDLIGKAYAVDTSKSAAMASEFSSSRTQKYSLEQMVRPEELVALRTGGPMNKFIVEGYIHLQGNQEKDEFNHRKISFSQTVIP